MTLLVYSRWWYESTVSYLFNNTHIIHILTQASISSISYKTSISNQEALFTPNFDLGACTLLVQSPPRQVHAPPRGSLPLALWTPWRSLARAGDMLITLPKPLHPDHKKLPSSAPLLQLSYRSTDITFSTRNKPIAFFLISPKHDGRLPS